ncbi:selenide, water dikinase SelD, partial [bacterium]
MGPEVLASLIGGIDFPASEKVVVGASTGDDAGVYLLDGELALIQTVDFISPVTDDPYLFGQIAAANSISDVYAMGGKPITAMNLFAFPACELGGERAKAILEGAADKIRE